MEADRRKNFANSWGINMFITINHNRYWIEQAGRGAPLLLLHGFTGSSQTWQSLMKVWSHQFHVISIDLPGHGKTVMNEPFSMESFCLDLTKILATLKLKKVHLLGYSMGGRTALSFTILYPEYVQSLILESASPGLKTEDERQLRIQQDKKLINMLKQKGIEAFVQHWENIPLFASQKKLTKEVQNQLRQKRLQQKTTGLIQSLTFMGTGIQPSWWDKLKEITIPTLLMAGEIDQKFININKEMYKLMPNATLEVVPKAGHTIHVEVPEKFVKIVSDFIIKSSK
jgi:2-succinyl-6-hydroxy-2,4-cyclohexadiene-1-carboxylate synthase